MNGDKLPKYGELTKPETSPTGSKKESTLPGQFPLPDDRGSDFPGGRGRGQQERLQQPQPYDIPQDNFPKGVNYKPTIE
jgi:hypothetical protein